MPLVQCKIVSLPKISDLRGSLTFIEGNNHIPFDIKRIYYLYNIPENAERGAHGHKELQQLIIAVSGSFDVILDDGSERKTFQLNSPDSGLYVCPGMWRDIVNVSQNAVCLVLASQLYDENDYLRNYDDFLGMVGK